MTTVSLKSAQQCYVIRDGVNHVAVVRCASASAGTIKPVCWIKDRHRLSQIGIGPTYWAF